MLCSILIFLEHSEELLDGGYTTKFAVFNLKNVETNSLGERAALTDGGDISFLGDEGGGKVGRYVLVTLLVTTVLGDIAKVVSSDDDGTLHLGGEDESLEDTTTDGNITGEGALLVDVLTLDGRLGGLEAKSNIFVVTKLTLHLLTEHTLTTEEHSVLLLESILALF